MHFILGTMINSEGKLLHRYRNGESGLQANIDDYTFLIAALLDLYEVTYKNEYLKNAILLSDKFIKQFRDHSNGGYFFTPDDAEILILRSKELYDGAVPSGNSIAMLNMIRLAKITGSSIYENEALQTINVFSRNIYSTPSAYTQALTSLDFIYGPSYEIVICGERENDDTKEMIKILNENFVPNKVVILNSPDSDEAKSMIPFIKDKKQIQNKSTAYVCVNYTCKSPVNTVKEFEKLLNKI